jgi:hypothetical protein
MSVWRRGCGVQLWMQALFDIAQQWRELFGPHTRQETSNEFGKTCCSGSQRCPCSAPAKQAQSESSQNRYKLDFIFLCIVYSFQQSKWCAWNQFKMKAEKAFVMSLAFVGLNHILLVPVYSQNWSTWLPCDKAIWSRNKATVSSLPGVILKHLYSNQLMQRFPLENLIWSKSLMVHALSDWVPWNWRWNQASASIYVFLWAGTFLGPDCNSVFLFYLVNFRTEGDLGLVSEGNDTALPFCRGCNHGTNCTSIFSLLLSPMRSLHSRSLLNSY